MLRDPEQRREHDLNPTADGSYLSPLLMDSIIYLPCVAVPMIYDTQKNCQYPLGLSEFWSIAESIVWREIDLDDFDFDEETGDYHTPCKCGGRFCINEDQLAEGCVTTDCYPYSGRLCDRTVLLPGSMRQFVTVVVVRWWSCTKKPRNKE